MRPARRAAAGHRACGRAVARGSRRPNRRFGQAFGGCVAYDSATETYSLTEEQTFILANPDGAVCPGAFVLALWSHQAVDTVVDAFRTGVAERITFDVASAQDFPGAGYDRLATFDCLHDMGDPLGAATHIRQSLVADGTWLIVEPYAGKGVTQNLNPIGRVYYGFSLGAKAGGQAMAGVLAQAASPGSVARPRRRSTSCTKPGVTDAALGPRARDDGSRARSRTGP